MNFKQTKSNSALLSIAIVMAGMLLWLFFFADKNLNETPQQLSDSNQQDITLKDETGPTADTVSLKISDRFKPLSEAKGAKAKLAFLDRLREVESLNLSSEEIEYIQSEIKRKDLDLVVRNNLSNVLIRQNQESPIPGLHAFFQVMTSDSKEDPAWRDYATQFFSYSYEHASEEVKIEIINHLMKLAREGDPRDETDSATGTALLMLHNIKRDYGNTELKIEDLVLRGIEDKTYDLAYRVICVAIAGDGKVIEALPMIADIAKVKSPNALKRTAIATLGLIGEKQHLPLIEKATRSRYRDVALAAKQALPRLQARLKQVEANG